MPKTAEVDPLLPHNNTSPEITYGSAPQSVESATTGPPPAYPGNYENDSDAARPDESTRTILSTIISIVFFVAFFAVAVTILNGFARAREPEPYPGHPNPAPSTVTWPYPKPTRTIQPRPVPTQSIEDRVVKILTETPLIDGHNDLAIFIRVYNKNAIYEEDFRDKFENGGLPANVDLPRLRKGMVGGALWSAFVVCPEHASDDFSDEQYGSAVSHTLQQIDLLKRLQMQYDGHFTAAGTSLESMLENFHATKSMFGPISIEGLHQVPQSAAMSTLRMYYALGVRAATLTWNCHNAFADAALITTNGSTTLAPYHRGGLTDEGRKVVQEMNRLGMLVDISHTSYWTQKAVLSNGTSRAPVIYSHSSAFALCPHPRNVKDDLFELVKETGSLIMVNFSPAFISCQGDGEGLPEYYDKNNTLHQVARHIMYIGDKIGYDYVGLGSDFDGMGDEAPRGLDGVDKYPDLLAELLKLGVTDQAASKLVGGNLLRVWKRAEEVATEMRKEGVPVGEDKVSGY